MHAEHQDGNRGMLRPEPLENLEEPKARHAHIKQHDVGRDPGKTLQQLEATADFAYDLEAGSILHDATETLPDDRVIIGDHEPDHCCTPLGERNGIRSETRVP